jgi:hypothetical protein
VLPAHVSCVSAQITLKNPWAKVIDTITAKATSSELTEFVACYPGQLADRISLVKVGVCTCRTPTTGCLTATA